jgi:hypothetical protein
VSGIWKTESEEYEDNMNRMAADVGEWGNDDLSELEDGAVVMLHPLPGNPLHRKPVRAVFSSGYFYCDGTKPENGPDYYWGDVLTYCRIEQGTADP